METQEIKAESYIPLARELREKRKMMGLKAVDIHKPLNINQGNYSKMENAFTNPMPALDYVRDLYKVWRDKEIKLLNDRLMWLKKAIDK